MILDTNAVSALLAGDRAIEPVLASRTRHEVPVIVVGEYRYGLQRSRSRKTLEPLLEQLLLESVVLDVDLDTAKAYAVTRDRLRRAGHPVAENDLWIAALGIQHDLPVVSRDAAFKWVEGLRRVTW